MHVRHDSSIMSSSNSVSSKALSMPQQSAKLYASVALQIRVGGQTLAVLGHKVAEDLVPVLIHKVGFIQGNAQMRADSFCVSVVFLDRAVLVAGLF